MSKFGGIPVDSGSKFGGVPISDEEKLNSPLQAARAGLQGLTFGFSDEAGAAIAALAGSIKTGEDFGDVYSKIHSDLSSKREQFREESPVLAYGSEIAGGALTGAAGAGRALASDAVRGASRLGKLGAISGVGAVEGGLYGAGAANENDRLSGSVQGALGGSVLAPVGAGIANSIGRVGGSITNYAADKLSKTPQDIAKTLLRDTAEASGETPASISQTMRDLGPEATIADVNDSFATLARGGMNKQGTMREKGLSIAYKRQAGQQDRLMKSIESVSGKSSAFKSSLEDIINRKKEVSAPLYNEAKAEGLSLTENLKAFYSDPLPEVKRAVRTGTNYAKSEGDESVINQFHYIKQALDDEIGKAIRAGEKNKSRILMGKKRTLLSEIEAQNPKYIEAMNVFADESALERALTEGRKILSRDTEEIASDVAKMTDGEKELFKLGGVKAIADLLDKVGNNRDSAAKLMSTPRIRKQLSIILGDDAGPFLKRAGIEEQFSKTKGALTGNSTTALQQEAGKAINEATDSGMLKAIENANPSSIISNILKTATRAKANPEIINNLGNMMFKQGMSEREIKQIFQSNAIRRAFGDEYDKIVAPYVQSISAPALMPMTQN